MLTKLLLMFTGALFVIGGLAGLFFDDFLREKLYLDIDEQFGKIEIMAMYGGGHLLLGCWMLISAFRRAWVFSGLVVLITLVGGLFIGRVVGVATHGMPANYLAYLFLVGEAALTLCAVYALFKTPRSVPAEA